jgi:hypothetical protein
MTKINFLAITFNLKRKQKKGFSSQIQALALYFVIGFFFGIFNEALLTE